MEGLTHDLNEISRDEMIESNFRLVTYVASRYYSKYIGTDVYEDIYQEGCIGLLQAVDNFDPSLGNEFSTYAVPMIYGSMRRYIRDNVRQNGLKISRSILELQSKILHLRDSENSSVEEMAEKLSVSKQQVLDCINSLGGVRSLDEPISDDSGDSLGCFVSCEESGYAEIESDEYADKIAEFIQKNYTGVTREILEELLWTQVFFDDKLSQMELATRYKVSQVTVSRVMRKFASDARKYGLIAG